MTPFIKWAGGKTSLLPEIASRLPPKFNSYLEPFVGGGSLLLHLRSMSSPIVNDFNPVITNLYEVFSGPQQEYDLFKQLSTAIQSAYNALTTDADRLAMYVKYRDMDRSQAYQFASKADRAARFLFLNKTSFNGVYRENRKGYFNQAFGYYKKAYMVGEDFDAIRSYFLASGLRVMTGDFLACSALAKPGDFVYFDPPYDPIVTPSHAASYSSAGFSGADQARVSSELSRLASIGVYAMASNYPTELICRLYSGLRVDVVSVNRGVSSSSSTRGSVQELMAMNYHPDGRLITRD